MTELVTDRCAVLDRNLTAIRLFSGKVYIHAKQTPGSQLKLHQLKTKTQPEVSKWLRLALNSDWFDVNIQSVKINDAEHEATWRTDFATWSDDNPQAFAGAHNKGKRLVIIFDEAAEISDVIYKTVEGALTDADT